MAFAAVHDAVPALAWWLFAGNLCWVVAYDTEYAMVDRDDDLKLGLRTSAIAFGLFALWPAMSGHLGRPAWPLRRRVGVVVSVLGFVLIEATLFGIVTRSDTGGLRELLLYAATSLWPLVVVLWTRLAGPGTAVPPVRRPVVGAQPGATNGQGGATTG
jgi:hypothetical protein